MTTYVGASDLARPVTRAEFDALAETFWRGDTARAVLRDQHRDIYTPPLDASAQLPVTAQRPKDGERRYRRDTDGSLWERRWNDSTKAWEYAGGGSAYVSTGVSSAIATAAAGAAPRMEWFVAWRNAGAVGVVPNAAQYGVPFDSTVASANNTTFAFNGTDGITISKGGVYLAVGNAAANVVTAARDYGSVWIEVAGGRVSEVIRPFALTGGSAYYRITTSALIVTGGSITVKTVHFQTSGLAMNLEAGGAASNYVNFLNIVKLTN